MTFLPYLANQYVARVIELAMEFDSTLFAFQWIESEALDMLNELGVFTNTSEAMDIVRAVNYSFVERN